MATLIFCLQITVASIFLLNKILVLVGRKSGWLVGALASLIAIVYFFLIHLYVFTILQCGLIVLMGCGFLTHRSNRLERLINITILIAMMALTYFAFSGLMTILEFISSALLLVGTYCLTHKKVTLGWTIYCPAHICAAIVMYTLSIPQVYSADMQVASALIALVGILYPKNNRIS